MKNILSLLILGFLFSQPAFAQDPGKDFKNAEKSLKKFFQDETKLDELNSAMTSLKAAFEDSEFASEADNWIERGELMNELANEEFKRKTIDPTYELAAEDAAIKAYKSFKKASTLTDKKNALRDIEDGLLQAESHLNNFAIFAYQVQDYGTAFRNFAASVEAYDLLKALGKDSRLDGEGLLMDQYFFTSVSGYYSNNLEESEPFLVKLYEANSDEAFVYEALFNINKEKNLDQALVYLQKGREMFPEDTGLLFAEINYYLKKGELDALISKLELALEKEPDNVSIYTTLGSVYDQLHVKAREENDMDAAQEYFVKAESYYNQVLEKDPDNFDATYSIGALYYNKAATYVDRLNELASDLSPAGMKSYDKTKAEMDSLFNEALPFFVRAEQLNGSDLNTLIALKEIYARLNDLEKSEEYKGKMDSVRGQ